MDGFSDIVFDLYLEISLGPNRWQWVEAAGGIFTAFQLKPNDASEGMEVVGECGVHSS